MSRSSADFAHEPVMVDEVVALFAPVPDGAVLDATLGGAGHAAAILDAHPNLSVIGLDRDPEAVGAATNRLAPYGHRARVHHARFDALSEVVASDDAEPLSGVLFDLGVSSPQLDRGERGFAFRHDGPLDMRMDPTTGRSASDVVNESSLEELTRLLRDGGETRWAHRIARAIVASRPITTTGELAELVRNAIPAAARRTGGHPATRSFQALRIAVNDELAILPGAIDDAIAALAPRGRCVVLAYHSGEDRIVKQRFNHAVTGGCTCPPNLPCGCGAQPKVTLVFRGARKASVEELTRNHRAESARLRACEAVA
ncbi:MAG TPA: 16S rRNA (cytosine(1402)-N(4))-methyltransferase RsmH [Acidimicrobiales bacterium]|nr:16S rRNA (cytosine(1402)-N(4))-methyltransferase RsmH [Acidimicrobiales bacterium]